MSTKLTKVLSLMLAVMTLMCIVPVGTAYAATNANTVSMLSCKSCNSSTCFDEVCEHEHAHDIVVKSHTPVIYIMPTATCSCSTSYAGTYTTKNVSSSLTIRSAHSTSSSSKGSIPSGATFTVTMGNGTWAHVKYNNIEGYASMSYMQRVTPTCNCSTSYAGTYTTKNVSSSLTIRSAHSTSSSSKGSIPSGATFTVTMGNGTWAHVKYNNIEGYASMSYMQRVTPTCNCSTSYAGTYTTKNVSSSLTIRSAHSTSSSSKGSIPSGATFTVTMGNGTWAHVKYNNIEGYSNMSYMQRVTPTCNCSMDYEGIYTTKNVSSSLTIRSAHSTSSSSKGSIPSGATFTVTMGNGTWAHVKYNNIEGYSNMSYMQRVTPTCNCSMDYEGIYTTKNVSSSLTIRSAHSTSSSSKGSIPSGATFTVTMGNGTWAHVKYNNIEGYASMSYMQRLPENGGDSSFSPRTSMSQSDTPAYYTTNNIFHQCGYGMPNCTCYAYGRAYEILGKKPNLCTGNAGEWYDYNKTYNYYPYGTTPKLGAIAVWKSLTGGPGHVAVVEVINGNTVTTSESAWKGTYFFTTERSASDSNFGKNSNYKFMGFIYILG